MILCVENENENYYSLKFRISLIDLHPFGGGKHRDAQWQRADNRKTKKRHLVHNDSTDVVNDCWL